MIRTLEGGPAATTDPADVPALHELRHLGIDADTDAGYRNHRKFDLVRQGYRCHLGSIPAAIGLAQIEMVDEFVANRQEYCRVCDEASGGLEERGDVVLVDTDRKDVAPYIYVKRVEDTARQSDLIAYLDGLGVSTGIHFLGAHEFSFYAGCRRDDPTVTDQVTEQVLTLPLHSYMDQGTLGRVTDDVLTFFRAALT
jgi:dTDP-4-amino-4,6-dideoxygalactose transaminase